MSERRETSEPISSPQADYDALRFVSDEVPCPYLPERKARNEAFVFGLFDGATYERLMAHGFRRSGRVVYRPICRGCRECLQLRVAVPNFRPSKSMRRVSRRNLDLRVEIGDATATDEKYELFARYLETQHDDTMPRTQETFEEFLYDAPTPTCEFRYWLGERLIGVSVIDVCGDGLSSLYMYFDPAHAARSLGTFSAVKEIEYCQRRGFAYYYLGFYVAGCAKMAYKARFRPNEVLVGANTWAMFRE